MSHCTITLSANAGISLEWKGYRLWVDALHTDQRPGFSTVTPALWEQMQDSAAFAPPDLLCFTHCHSDHYSHELTAEAKALWPNAKLIMPQQEFDSPFLLTGDEVRFSDGDITLRFLRLPHEGSAFAAVPHYGLLLSDGVFRILIAGDCEIASPALSQHLQHTSVDLSILDFPWLTLNKGRQYVENVLRPRHLLLYHLPFPEDDVNGYLNAARQATALSDLADIRILCNPLQQEVI